MLSAAETSLNIKFLSLVENKPCLYDSRVPADRSTIQRAWEEIANEMKKIYLERGEAAISAEDCIKKWNYLRKSFFIDLKNYPSETEEEYSKRNYMKDAMKFLQPDAVPKISPSVIGSTFREVNLHRCSGRGNDKTHASVSAISAGQKDRQSATNKVVNQKIGQMSKNFSMSNTRHCIAAISNQQEISYHKGFPVNVQSNMGSKNTQISHDVRNNHRKFQGKTESNYANNYESSDVDKLKATVDKKQNFPTLTKESPQSSNSKAVVDIIKLEKAESKGVSVLDNIKKEMYDTGFADIKKIEKVEETCTVIWENMKEEKADPISCALVKDNQVISQATPAIIGQTENKEKLHDLNLENTPNKTQLVTGCQVTKGINKISTKRKNETSKPLQNKKMKLASTQSQRGVRKLNELEDSRNLFLQSLLPDVRKLSDNQFRSFRMRVSDIIMEYFIKN